MFVMTCIITHAIQSLSSVKCLFFFLLKKEINTLFFFVLKSKNCMSNSASVKFCLDRFVLQK